MEVSDLVAQLINLQIEQTKIIEQIAAISETADKKPKAKAANNDLEVGDHALLLTSGARCRKGDTARVTKITTFAVHFIVLRNNHNTFKKHHNAQKIQQA